MYCTHYLLHGCNFGWQGIREKWEVVLSWVFVRVLVNLSQFPDWRLQSIYLVLNTNSVVRTVSVE